MISLQTNYLSAPPGEVPALLNQLWQGIREDTYGFYATLKKANFYSKKALPSLLSVDALEGRFCWQEDGVNSELRWKQCRQFNGVIRWHVILAGPFGDRLEGEYKEEKEKEEKEEEIEEKVYLWGKKDRTIPTTLNYPSLWNPMYQRVWKEDGIPFHYQWLPPKI